MKIVLSYKIHIFNISHPIMHPTNFYLGFSYHSNVYLQGSQTSYHNRPAGPPTHRRESVSTWKHGKRDRKHSLTDAIMAIAPPPVIEQETSMATSTIYEEVNRTGK